MKVYLGTDHTGLELKGKIIEFLSGLGYETVDSGAYELNKDDDYPDFIAKAAEGVSKDEGSMGVVFGGSGQGEAMVSNKFPNVRCALFYSLAVPEKAIDISGTESTDPYEMLKLTRAHNNSNMLSIGMRFLTEEQILKAIRIFLEAPFTGEERHKRRIEKIRKIEESLQK